MEQRNAIVCMSYGTDLSGNGPSPMMRAVVERAKELEVYYPEAGYFLQGGYTFNGGPVESQIMEKLLVDRKDLCRIYTEKTSRNTIEGAKAIIRLAQDHNYNNLVVVAQSCHAWRVRYTFQKLLNGKGIALKVISVSTPFGGNSQLRLNLALSWWIWDIFARVYTAVFVR